MSDQIASSFKARAWCFTINNYTDQDIQNLQDLEVKYIVWGLEEAPSTGTPHIQGYVEFSSPRSFSSVKKMIPRVHLEKRRGTAKQASDYCKKDRVDIYEDGVISHMGARNDIKAVVDAITKGSTFEDIIDNATSYQSLQIAKVAFPYKEPKRTWKPEIIWLYGPPGVGKTWTPFLENPDARIHMQSGTGQWWQGYDRHEVVVIDDFRQTQFKYVDLLHILDRYPYVIEYKGSSRQFVPLKIYITSPHHPIEYYTDEREDSYQLIRRITEIRHIAEKIPEVDNPPDGV